MNECSGLSLSGYTPLIAAVRGNQPNVVRLLLAKGAEIETADYRGQDRMLTRN